MEKLSGTDKRTGRSNKYAGVPLIHPLTAKNPMSNSEIKLINSKKARPPQIDNPVKIDRHLVAFHDPSGVEAELFKMLRTNILFPKSGHPPRTIMVTSALPGDGKSFGCGSFAVT